MPNLTTWQFPSGSERSEYGGHAQPAAAAEYAVGSAPVAAELGIQTTPLYETADPQPADTIVPEQYSANTGESVPADHSQAVLDAARNVDDVFEPQPASAELVDSQEYSAAAYKCAAFYGNVIDGTMRENALRRDDLTLAS